MKVFDILLFPFRIIYAPVDYYIVSPLARLILKSEIIREKKLLNNSYERNRELNSLKEVQEKNIKKLSYRLDRMKGFLLDNKKLRSEVFLTRNEEIVFISYNIENIFDNIYLHGENGENNFWDSQMAFNKWGDELSVENFQTRNDLQNNGYGRVLLEFAIKKAKELGVKHISGKLSDRDKENFSWLLPFYESFGFKCIIYDEPKGPILGHANLSLN